MIRYSKIIVPVAALIVGAVIGLGIGQLQVASVKKAAQDKVNVANKKVAFLQSKLMEEQNRGAADQKCSGDLEIARKEKEAADMELKRAKGEVQALEAKTGETENTLARTKNDLRAMELKYTKEATHTKELEGDLRKTIQEKLTLQADLKKTTRNLGQCEANNAKLCTIADEILKKYRSKGVGEAMLQREPLTQIRKVELEQFTQKYRDEIEKQKFQKK